MGELGAALNVVFAKVGDFFDIFDLSFFVAGVVCFGALTFAHGLGGVFDPGMLAAGYKVIAFAVVCYVLGLVCFASGRMLRPKRDLFRTNFRELVERHGLGARYGQYLSEPHDAYLLYNRFWAEMRQTAALAPSFSLLRRYWSMAATYDGLTAAFLVWWVVLVHWCVVSHAPLILRLPPLAVVPAAALVCRREAARLMRFQVEELTASIAALEKTRQATAPSVVGAATGS
jgi:hypothetical protein